MTYGILGPLLVIQDGREVAVTSAKQRSILSALLMRANSVVLVDQLIDEAWGARAPSSAHDLVATYVWRLRCLLGDGTGKGPIRGEPGGYRLHVADDDLDLARFRRLSASGREHLASGDSLAASVDLRSALNLWRGEPLANVELYGGLSHELLALAEERTAVLEQRIDADLASGRHDAVTGELRQLAEEHPTRERFACQLMLALYRSGRRDDALVAYQRAQAHLARELGIKPGEDISTLHQAILRADPGLLVPGAPSAGRMAAFIRPNQLPGTDSGFRGRDAELALLDSLLAAHRADARLSPLIVTLNGDAGVGKTSLAVQWGHRVRAEFPDGQLFASLHGYRRFAGTTPQAVLRHFLRSLGLSADQIPADPDEAAARYRAAVADRRILILLDDVADPKTATALLPGTGGCGVVLTSREPLTELSASHGAVRVPVGPLTSAESRMLLMALAGDPDRLADQSAADELVALCGRVPLALRFAAAQLAEHPMITVRDYVSQVSAEPPIVLRIGGQEAARRSIELPLRKLSTRDARTLELLALVDTPRVSVPAAAALLGFSVEAAGQVLRRLANSRLLEDDGAGWYTMHDLVRGYVAERAQETRNAAITRWLEWCLAAGSLADRMVDPDRYQEPLSSTAAAEPLITLGSFQDALAWLDAERPSLVAAVFQAADCDPGLAWRIAWAIYGYFHLRKHWAEWIDTYRTGLSCAARAADRHGQAVMSYGLAVAYYYPRRFTEALDGFHRALSLFREMGDSRGTGITLNMIGNVHAESGRLEKGLHYYGLALAIHRRDGHVRDEGIVLNNLSEVYVKQGRYSDAERYAQIGLDIQRAVGNQRIEVFTLCHLGNARWRLGAAQDAVSLLHEALVLADEIGDRHGLAWAAGYLGQVLWESGANAEARRYVEQAVELFTELGDPQAADTRETLMRLTRDDGDR